MNVSAPPSIGPLAPASTPPAPPASSEREAAPGASVFAASLWELLTPEERDFFGRQAALGPLTYRPGGAAPAAAPGPAPLGQRIDVRA